MLAARRLRVLGGVGCRILSGPSAVGDALAARVACNAILDEPGQRAAADGLDAYACTSSPREDACALRPWAYLHGPVGSGKTMLLDLFYEQQCLIAAPARPPLRMHFHDFVLRTHEQLHATHVQRPRQVRKTLSGLDVYVYGDAQDGDGRSTSTDTLAHVARALAREHELICLDELCVTDLADALIIGRLLDRLLHEGVRLVFTSNQPPAKLFESGRNRAHFVGPLATLLRSRCVPIHVDVGGLDYRELLATASATADGAASASAAGGATPTATVPSPERSARARRSGRWLSGEDGGSAFEHAWQECVKRAGGEAREAVPVAFGRAVDVERTADGAMRATFAQLCDTGRGTPDYYALARRFDTLYLCSVPILGRKREEAARRLISLVDVAYDEHVRLVVRAEDGCAAPDAVFEPLLHGSSSASEALPVGAVSSPSLPTALAAAGELRWMIRRCTSRLREMTAAAAALPKQRQ